MAIRLPYRSDSSVPVPEAVRAHGNGLVPPTLLHPCSLRSFVMAEPAAGAMRSLVAAAARDGVVISSTGTWRSYDQQEQLFRSRYVGTDTGGTKKVWKGTPYWQLPKVASAATPGTSNHGWGVAADLSNSPTEVLGGTTLQWLVDHGPSFGFWNTVKSEVWHWSYCLGDDVADGVDQSPGGAPAAPAVDWNAIAETDRTLSATTFAGELRRGAQGVPVRAVQWKLVSNGHDVRVDGDFGVKTENSVKTFQLARALRADGRVGKKTWASLGLPGAGSPPPPPPTESPGGG
jgi:D-alanyl-D-alanine carboxypeptidase/Putative peptidoglycan binding domain